MNLLQGLNDIRQLLEIVTRLVAPPRLLLPLRLLPNLDLNLLPIHLRARRVALLGHTARRTLADLHRLTTRRTLRLIRLLVLHRILDSLLLLLLLLQLRLVARHLLLLLLLQLLLVLLLLIQITKEILGHNFSPVGQVLTANVSRLMECLSATTEGVSLLVVRLARVAGRLEVLRARLVVVVTWCAWRSCIVLVLLRLVVLLLVAWVLCAIGHMLRLLLLLLLWLLLLLLLLVKLVLDWLWYVL